MNKSDKTQSYPVRDLSPGASRGSDSENKDKDKGARGPWKDLTWTQNPHLSHITKVHQPPTHIHLRRKGEDSSEEKQFYSENPSVS